jgi:hypothetical protein
MVSALFFSQSVLIALVWLCLMLHWAWSSNPAACPTTPEPSFALPKRKREPKPFADLSHKPHCEACEPTPDLRLQAPQLRPRGLGPGWGDAGRLTPPPPG